MSEYSFENFKDFFEFNLKKFNRDSEGAKIFTLSDLSKKLGYNSPSLLSMIAHGKRLPSSEILEMLFDEWKVESNQREIIRLRLDIEKKIKKNKPTRNLIERLCKLDKKSKFKIIDLDTFNSIREWHNLVLQMMVSTPGFKEDYILIANQLRKKVTPAQVRKGFETLIKVGLLKRNYQTGELESKTADSSIETTHDIPSEAIREHHKGMINRALEAVDEQTVDERHLNSLTIKFDKSKKTEAKNAILNFVKEFNDKFYDADSKDIHQLNVQFFEHTNSFQKANKDMIQ